MQHMSRHLPLRPVAAGSRSTSRTWLVALSTIAIFISVPSQNPSAKSLGRQRSLSALMRRAPTSHPSSMVVDKMQARHQGPDGSPPLIFEITPRHGYGPHSVCYASPPRNYSKSVSSKECTRNDGWFPPYHFRSLMKKD